MSVAGTSEALPAPIAGLVAFVPFSSRLYCAVAVLNVTKRFCVCVAYAVWTRLRLWSDTTFKLAVWLQKLSVTGQFPLAAALAAMRGAMLLRTTTLVVAPPSWVVPPAVIQVMPVYIQYIRDWTAPLSGISITELLTIWSPFTPAMPIPVLLLTRTTLLVIETFCQKPSKIVMPCRATAKGRFATVWLSMKLLSMTTFLLVMPSLSSQFHP